MGYPIFYNPEAYLELRKGRNQWFASLKRWFEWRAIRKCLTDTGEINTICDAPSGPGRLFPLWKHLGFEVVAADLSRDFVPYSQHVMDRIKLSGVSIRADAFEITRHVKEVDLVVCVRFLYYFQSSYRIALLREFASLAKKYVLVQYKSDETWKGRRNARRKRRNSPEFQKHFCNRKTIIQELGQAGLECVNIVPIARTSDRVFVIARPISVGSLPGLPRPSHG